ncbi:MAG: proton-conducting transporter transmembrane domain-containing protein, partial [bacterium]
SGVLTKVGIFGILMTSLEAFPNHPALGAAIYVLGIVTMFLGALLALFSVNLKRTLACSSMSQVGFILTGLGSFVLQGALEKAAEAAEILREAGAGATEILRETGASATELLREAGIGAAELLRETGAGAAELLRTAGESGAEVLRSGASGTLSALSGEIGEGQILASSGLMLHMVNHSMLKLALFMIAGVVVMNLHKLDLNEIRGWGRKKPLLKLAFALGGLGISGVPFFNGYISKTMLHEGIVELIVLAGENAGMSAFVVGFLKVSEWIFLISGGLTFAYMTKLFLCVFVEKNADPRVQAVYDGMARDAKRPSGGQLMQGQCPSADTDGKRASGRRNKKKYMNGLSAFAILGSAVFMVILGQPAVMTRLAAFMTGNAEILEFHAFTLGNLKGGFISLGIGAAVYLLVVRGLLMSRRASGEKKARMYVDCWPKGLDLEERVYRPLLTKVLPGIFGAIVRVPAENLVSKNICCGTLAAGKVLAKFFGENRALVPLCKGIVLFGTFVGRCLSTGTDALIMLLRKTIFRERRVRTAEDFKPGKLRTAVRVTQDALRPLAMNFSFALMMTCIGIVVFIVVLLLTVL